MTSQSDIEDIDDNADEDDRDSGSSTNPIIHGFNPLDASMHVKFGSREALQTFGLVENSHKDDDAFTNFRVKLNSFLNVFLPASNITLPDGKRVHLLSNHTVSLLDSVAALTNTLITRKRSLHVDFCASTMSQWWTGDNIQITFGAIRSFLMRRVLIACSSRPNKMSSLDVYFCFSSAQLETMCFRSLSSTHMMLPRAHDFEKTSTSTFLEFEQNHGHRQNFFPSGLSFAGHF